MSEMVDSVARAICKAMELEWDDLGYLDPQQSEFEDYARAAIEAMREPTSEILDAGRGYCDTSHNAGVAYRAMIAAALGDDR